MQHNRPINSDPLSLIQFFLTQNSLTTVRLWLSLMFQISTKTSNQNTYKLKPSWSHILILRIQK